MIRTKIILTSLLFIFSVTETINAKLRLGSIFADNMVLQQEKPVKVWGSAEAREILSVEFRGEKIKTKADKKGNWIVEFPAFKYGGPYKLTVNGKKETISIKNILIGELWLASGQSNMEMPIEGWGKVNQYEQEIANANYPSIRMFTVEKSLQVEPQKEFKGHWDICSPNTVGEFSATAYFFARKLNEELNIPIGIIHSSWGGTEIESWISGDTYSLLPSDFWNKYNLPEISDFNSFVEENKEAEKAFLDAYHNDVGLQNRWYENKIDPSDWVLFHNPQEWNRTELEGVEGVVWFKYNLNIICLDTLEQSKVSLGTIDDNETTWINGIQVGKTKGYNIERYYDVPTSILKEGKNTIIVRVQNESGEAGFTANADKMFLQVGDNKYSLVGEWEYKIATDAKDYNFTRITPYSLPSLLYNGMINPVVRLPIRGVIWYQGESNENNAEDYKTLFPALINDWRKKWNDTEMPFYWVQLANYKAKDDNPPTTSKWALLREAQSMALELPNTGQAVITDIGDTYDVHPKNKQDVGKRLAFIALHKSYKKNVVCSGPSFKSSKKIGDKVQIYLDNVQDGLIIKNKYGYIEGFSLAGPDGKHYWAKAYLDGNSIIVSSENVSNPVQIRYSWSDNPDVNLFNSANLPLAPFKIDLDNNK